MEENVERPAEKSAIPRWTVAGIEEAIVERDRAFCRSMAESWPPNDDDFAAALKDWTDGPEDEVRWKSMYGHVVVDAATNDDIDGMTNSLNAFFGAYDAAQKHESECNAAGDAWKDKPVKALIPAPIASAVKSGENGISVSFAAQLLWLMVVLFLQWIAWKAIS